MQLSNLILANNNQFIVLNKPPTIASQGDKTGDKSILDLAEIYCKHPLHIINRVDRPASGIVVLAKSKKAASSLSSSFQKQEVVKKYLAVVKNSPEKKEGTLKHFITKINKINKSVVTDNGKGAHEVELSYKLVDQIDNYGLLEISVKTGRFHQIRAQLSAEGMPIKGDVKYGAKRSNKDRSIHLHAWKKEIIHPITKVKLSIVAALPDENVWNAFSYPKEKV